MNLRTTNGGTMLMLASYGGHLEACEALLALRADLFARNAWDCDAGHFAAMGGSVAVCRWLAAQGLSLCRPQVSGHTALDKALDAGQEEVVRFLRAGGAQVQAKEPVPEFSASGSLEGQRAHPTPVEICSAASTRGRCSQGTLARRRG